LIDVPNERSSHRVATPRGGGAAIVIVYTVAMLVLPWVDSRMAVPWAVVLASLVVALVGFIDDHGHVPPIVRLIGHAIAAIIAIASVAEPPWGGATTPLAGWGHWMLAIFLIVWLVNLTNFMDGIDALASSQTITVAGAGAVMLYFVQPASGGWIEPAILAAATSGFLRWNWPPARVFLGDVGSGYLGFLVGVYALRGAYIHSGLGWSWVILSAVFVLDASVTLLRRVWRRERIFHAHRSHAYQHLARAWNDHGRVVRLAVLLNVFCLSPLAWLSATHRGPALGLLAAAYGLVFIVGVWASVRSRSV
jgi:Fuc2NAc and GlcNAc transferase